MNRKKLSFWLVIALMVVGVLAFRERLFIKVVELTAQSVVKKRLGKPLHYEKLAWRDGQLEVEGLSLGGGAFSAKAAQIKLIWVEWGKVELRVAVKSPHFQVREDSASIADLLAHLGCGSYKGNVRYFFNLDDGVISVEGKKPLYFDLTADGQECPSVVLAAHFAADERFELRLKGDNVSCDLHQLPAAAISPYLASSVRQLTRWRVDEGVLDGSFSIDMADMKGEGNVLCSNLQARHHYIPLEMSIGQLTVGIGVRSEELLSIAGLEDGKLRLDTEEGAGYLIKGLTGSASLKSLDNIAFNWRGICEHGEGSCAVAISGSTSFAKNKMPDNQIKIRVEGPLRELFPNGKISDELGDHHLTIETCGHKEASGIIFQGSAVLSPVEEPLEFGFTLHQKEETGFQYTIDNGWFHMEKLSLRPFVLSEKLSTLVFSDIRGEAKFAQQKIKIEKVEAFLDGIYLVGGADVDFSKREKFLLEVHLDRLGGKASQIKTVLAAIQGPSLLADIPFEGNLSLIKEGGWLKIEVEEDKPIQLQAKIEGLFSEGEVSKPGVDALVQDLSFNFDYDYAGDTLELKEMQGSLILGKPSDEDEYLLVADRLYFSAFSQNRMEFDLWIGDKKRDILRLAGTTKQAEQDPEKIVLTFDRQLTHFGEMHPKELELTLKNWYEIDYFKMGSQLRLTSFLNDLQKLNRSKSLLFSDTAIKAINWGKNLSGLIDVSIEYDKGLSYFTYEVTSHDLTLNQTKIDSLTMHGKKSGSLWTIDQLQVGDLSLSADLSRDGTAWKVKFLGLNYGKTLLMGLKGFISPEEGKATVALDLLEVQLDHLKDVSGLATLLGQFPPLGQIKAGGKVTFSLFDDERLWHVDADLKVSTKSVLINGSSLKDLVNAPLVFNGGPHQLAFSTRLPYGNQFFDLKMKTKGTEFSHGELILSKEKEGSIIVDWASDPSAGYFFNRIHGALNGINIDLDRNQHHAAQMAGRVQLDVAECKELFPVELQRMSNYFGLGNGYQLVGNWTLGEKRSLAFQGSLKGTDFDLRGYRLQALKADLSYTDRELLLKNVTIADGAGKLSLPEFRLEKAGESEDWHFNLKKLAITDFRPSLLKKALGTTEESASSLFLPFFELENMKGQVFDTSSWKGNGKLEFTTRTSHKEPSNPLFAVPTDMINRLGLDVSVLSPAYGEVSYEVLGNKIFLTKLKDVYSDGKLSKFSISNPVYSSFLDFSGNLSIHLKMKQYNLLFKFTELMVLNIKGNLERPVYTLQKQGASKGEIADD